MTHPLPIILGLLVAYVLGTVVLGRVRYGSLKGSFLKGANVKPVGTVELSAGRATQHLEIYVMSDINSGELLVGLIASTDTTMARAGTTETCRLSRSQAAEVVSRLQTAISGNVA